MPRYNYQAYDQHGALTKGSINAQSRLTALDAIHQQGQYPLLISEGTAAPAERWWQREVFGSRALPVADLGQFTRELALMTSADLPLDETLRMVSLQPLVSSRTRLLAAKLHERVREGASFSEALEESQRFPEFYWRLVRAGEAGGSLTAVLDELALLLERALEMRRQIGTALLYPLTLIAAAVGAMIVIATVLVPTMVPLFRDAGVALPVVVQVMVDLTSMVSRNWLAVVVLIIGSTIGAIAASRNDRFLLWRDRMLLALPIVGRLIRNREMARFARTVSTLIHNGVALLEAVRITTNVHQNSNFATVARDAAESLKEGRSLSSELAVSGLFSELAVRLVGIGEHTGQLDAMLMRTAIIYETALQRELARLMSLVSPILTLLIGALVGTLMLSVMNALLSLNELAIK